MCTGDTFQRIIPPCTHRSFPFVFTANADTKSKGVLIVIRDEVSFACHTEYKDPNGRFLILVCDINSVTYTIVNTYAPNTHQVQFFIDF